MARAGLGLAREGVTSRDDGCRNLVGNPSSFLPRRGPTSGRSGKFPFFFFPPFLNFCFEKSVVLYAFYTPSSKKGNDRSIFSRNSIFKKILRFWCFLLSLCDRDHLNSTSFKLGTNTFYRQLR